MNDTVVTKSVQAARDGGLHGNEGEGIIRDCGGRTMLFGRQI